MSSAEVLKQTTIVRQGHEIDGQALQRYLDDHLPGFSLPRRGPSDEGGLEVRQFEGGQSNPTYLLRAAGAHYVLRKKPSGATAAVGARG